MVPWLVTVTAVGLAGCMVVEVMVVVGIVVVVVAGIICVDGVVSGTVALTFVTSLALSSKSIVPAAMIGSVMLVTGALFLYVKGGTVFS